ncbi:hypothetical protein ACS0TY_020729 [Phlomoides rotata]
MAVAGLQNLSAFGPFFGESQSAVSRQWGDEPGTPSTRASSLLQMWREIEGDHVVSHSHRLRRLRNGSDSEGLSTSSSVRQRSDNGHDIPEDVHETENQVAAGSETDHDDDNSIISEQSSDLGEIERERVRQIFREWMNSCSIGNSSNGFHLNNRSGPQLLGDNECERVRIIREWAQMNSQQRNNRELVRDGGAEAGSHIEQVRDGLVVAHPEIGARRPIRRLCGRQTLLDLLQKADCERKEELQGLLEQKPVSEFTHRNRIQAFLRGRFLRNKIVIANERPSSVAASELGLLRQRHTVSGLREGFLSKLGSSASTSPNSAESDTSFGDQNNGESEYACTESRMSGISTSLDSEIAADGNMSHQEFRNVTEIEDPALGSVRNGREMTLEYEGHEQEVSYNEGVHQEVSLDVRSARSTEEHDLDGEATELEISSAADGFGNRDQVTEREVSSADGAASRHGEEITNDFPLEIEDIHQSGPHDVFLERYESTSGLSYILDATAGNTDIERNTDEPDRTDASSQLDELHVSVTETQDRAWQQLTSVAHTEWVNDVLEQDQMQGSHEDWPSHDLQEAIDSWLDLPSGEVGPSVERTDTYYFSDDDNVHSMELRELFSRRRVSGLLRSDFRESLDQVLQSHVERQGHASGGWELDNASSTPSIAEQDHGQENSGDRALDFPDAADRNLFAPNSFAPSSFVTASQPIWDVEMHDTNMPHNNLYQHLGTEWEVVNELRIDMIRLRQRLNNMQSILEQCMDMQIELQRSVRQEVSAALNRSILTRDASKGDTLYDESQLDHVRRGICCLCRDSNIDSLLYRCGHMCTCSKCAEKLIQDTGKCPMCCAPVVEAVRAYFIQ